MIYLQPEFITTQRDDTFWMWFNRTFESRYDLPAEIGASDSVLQYAVLGAPKTVGGRKFGLLWELYPEMRRLGLHVPVDEQKIGRMYECQAACNRSFVTSKFMLDFFPEAEMLPIGVDTDLFKPRGLIRQGAFWCGTDHPMKGMDAAHAWAEANKIPLTCVFKGSLPQTELAEVMSTHEYVILSGRLRPLYLVEWEALASGLKPIDVSGVEREFDIEEVSADPRGYVFGVGWSREQVEEDWRRILAN